MEVRMDQGDLQSIAMAVAEMLKPQLENLRNGGGGDEIMGVPELATYLGMSEKWVYDQTASQRIPFFKLGSILKFRKKDIDKWLRNFDTPAVERPTAMMKLVR
jgi:excisionase family DNA binding protein